MEITEIEKLLEQTPFEQFTGTFREISHMGYVYKDLFKIGNAESGFYVLKVRNKNKVNVTDSINLLKSVNDPDNLFNKYTGIIEKNDYIITISKWIDGIQPIENNRNALPAFFSGLASINKNNIITGPYTSMYLDGKYFNDINELIDYEIDYHKKYFTGKMNSKDIMEVMQILKYGIPCIINEDMNRGNFIITGDGEYRIIDTEWIIRGSNLYQFQHVHFFDFDGKKWYNIIDEAKECYAAYFETLGIKSAEANEQIRAIELLSVLRRNTYLKFFKKDNDSEMEKRIIIILEQKQFI